MVQTAELKLEKLYILLASLDSAVVAFSGGVDSVFLAAAAYRALGEKVVAVTASSETLPEWERQDAVALARQIGISHLVLPVSELENADFVNNTAERCYYCKKERFAILSHWAKDNGYAWVLEGSNADDLADYRPGMRAISELDVVKSPLLEVGLTKAQIRELSKAWGLPTWNKPSAACLSSRVAYGIPITVERLRQVEQAEACVRRFCARQVRVRHHGDLARIEVEPEDIPLLVRPDIAAAVTAELLQAGFCFVTLDLCGYRTGSMNEVLTPDK